MIELRPYQAAAVQAIYQHLRVRGDNPCCVVPTAGGKTPIMAAICRDAVKTWHGRVLILAHVRELLEQAVSSLHKLAPDLTSQIGVYSAGLKSRDTDHPIVVAGIQSVYRRADQLGPFDLILVDEAHMIPPDGEGMYQSFLTDALVVNPNLRLIGFTATDYRMTTGRICAPEHLLHHVCYEVGVRELIVNGYLCALKSKASVHKVDTSNLHLRGGEFIPGETEALMDPIVRDACEEICDYTWNRRSVLIFATSIAHAFRVQATMESLGHECGFVCGDSTITHRDSTLARFRQGELKYLVNVNVLTTGFDAPGIDSIILLRPTNSPGLYYQMVGRGFRLSPDKADCLVLDYGNNIVRHGPVDDMHIREPSKRGPGEAPAKECPRCHEVIHAAYTVCPECGFEFPPPDRAMHGRRASNAGVLSTEVTEEWHDVREVEYSIHTKRNAPDAPPTMRVDYDCGLTETHREWICFEHTGFARQRAEQWWRARSDEPVPDTVEQAVSMADAGCLAPAERIKVRSGAEKWDRVIDWVLGPRPEPMEASDDDCALDLDAPEEIVEESDETPMWTDENWYPDGDEIPF